MSPFSQLPPRFHKTLLLPKDLLYPLIEAVSSEVPRALVFFRDLLHPLIGAASSEDPQASAAH